jgi:sigma-B regulation protein RsbU (phosphoserine phosphatase)
MVLGIMPDATFSEQLIELGDGETLIVYSDGVSEAMNEAGDFFGDDRLFDAILRCGGLPSAAIGAGVLGAVRTFVGEAVPNDDLSLLVLKRHAAAG